MEQILIDIGRNFDITETAFQEIMKGAFTIIEFDDGYFYDNLKKYRDCLRDVSSSHRSCNKQYEIKLTHRLNSPVLLIGTTLVDYRLSTWFQLEKTSINSLTEHIFDYLHHLILDKNIGPLGNSIFTEKNPLHIYRKTTFNKWRRKNTQISAKVNLKTQ